MSKSKYNRLSTATAEQAHMVDLKKCKKVMKIDHNGNAVQMFINEAGKIVKTITEAENNAREFGMSAGGRRASRKR
mgnify:FL=1